MKKKTLIIASIVFVIAIVLLLVFQPWGKKLFKDLKASEVQEITVRLIPPEITFAVTEEELVDIVGVLNTIKIYSKDTSNEELCGQDVLFTITKTDETVISVRPMGGNLIEINGVRYHTNNEPNSQLNYIANNLESSKDG